MIKNQKGQVLLFVIVGLTIAMVIGISVAVSSLNSSARVTRTDSSSRVTAAAEGGIERFLALSISELENIIGGGDCPTGTQKVNNECIVTYNYSTGPTSDPIVGQARVTVARFSNNLTDPIRYEFKIDRGNVKEVALNGYTATNANLLLCWKAEANTTNAADLYYTIYDATGNRVKRGLTSTPARPGGTYATSPDGFSNPNATAQCPSGFSYGYTIYINNTDYGLRIRSLYANVSATVVPQGNGTLPTQGYLIKSIGELVNQKDVNSVKQIKTISVYKSLPYLPATFDFALYSKTDFN